MALLITLANPLGDVKAQIPTEHASAIAEKLARPKPSGWVVSLMLCRARAGRFARLLYCGFLMAAESKRGGVTSKRAAQATRASRRSSLKLVAQAALPTRFGRFRIYGFKGPGPQEEAVALVRGKLNGKSAPLVRVHSQCLTGDVLASLRCDCRAQLELSLRKIAEAPAGILLYLPQEGRGIGLMNKLRAYQLQDGGMDTVEANETLGFAADARDYDFSAQILQKLGAAKVRLLSNNPEKVRQLESGGIRVVERVPCQPRVSRVSRAYLQTKKRKMGHLLQGL
ncbi:MAG TPA: GTP cyclohydrolase II [Candidatus Acidoferrum sp.]|nr:GTP cyclohydrolase II [Candidatus Acidoferrum sp.]